MATQYDFTVTLHDLAFILQQIKISEAATNPDGSINGELLRDLVRTLVTEIVQLLARIKKIEHVHNDLLWQFTEGMNDLEPLLRVGVDQPIAPNLDVRDRILARLGKNLAHNMLAVSEVRHRENLW